MIMKRKQWHYKWGPRYIRKAASHTIGCGQVESHLNGDTVRFETELPFSHHRNVSGPKTMMFTQPSWLKMWDPHYWISTLHFLAKVHFVFLFIILYSFKKILCTWRQLCVIHGGFSMWHVPINLAIVDDCCFFTVLFW